MKRYLRSVWLLVLVGTCSLSSVSRADNLPANTPATPGVSVTNVADASTFLGAQQGSALVTTLSSQTFTGTLVSAVFLDKDTGHLDFVYQYHNDSTSADANERLTFFSFAGVDVFAADTNNNNFDSIDFAAGAVQANLANRPQISGDTVGFYGFSGGGIAPGSTTYSLILKTNWDSYTVGRGSAIDGSTAQGPAYTPVSEPASMLILGSGLLSLGGIRRRWIARSLQ